MLPRIIVFALLTALFTLALGVLQATVPALADVTALPQWGPGIAGLLTARLFWRDGLRIAFFDRTMPLRRYLWTALLPLGFGLLAYAYARWVMHAAWPLTFNVALVANMVFGAVGEEIGWRGYLQRRLALGVGPLLSAVIVGLLWLPFHMQYWPGGPVFLAFFGLALIAMSVMMAALLAPYRYNVLGASLFHLCINLTAALCGTLLLGMSVPFMAAYGLLAAAIAAGVVWVQRGVLWGKRMKRE